MEKGHCVCHEKRGIVYVMWKWHICHWKSIMSVMVKRGIVSVMVKRHCVCHWNWDILCNGKRDIVSHSVILINSIPICQTNIFGHINSQNLGKEHCVCHWKMGIMSVMGKGIWYLSWEKVHNICYMKRSLFLRWEKDMSFTLKGPLLVMTRQQRPWSHSSE